MTQRRLREFTTVTTDDRLMTNRSLIITLVNSRNFMMDQICSRCIYSAPEYLVNLTATPSQSSHRHHDGRAGGSVPARPTSGTANSRGGAPISVEGIHPGGGGDRLGGAQASPEPLGQPIGDDSGTSPLVADCCNPGQHT